MIAFLRGHDAVALDWFTRALERERSAENVGNVLAVLIRLGELQEARELVPGCGPRCRTRCGPSSISGSPGTTTCSGSG